MLSESNPRPRVCFRCQCVRCSKRWPSRWPWTSTFRRACWTTRPAWRRETTDIPAATDSEVLCCVHTSLLKTWRRSFCTQMRDTTSWKLVFRLYTHVQHCPLFTFIHHVIYRTLLSVIPEYLYPCRSNWVHSSKYSFEVYICILLFHLCISEENILSMWTPACDCETCRSNPWPLVCCNNSLDSSGENNLCPCTFGYKVYIADSDFIFNMRWMSHMWSEKQPCLNFCLSLSSFSPSKFPFSFFHSSLIWKLIIYC